MLGLLVLAVVLPGCATVGDQQGVEADPYESFNRGVYAFNSGLDQHVTEPLARGYKRVTPDPMDKGISNFFNNLADVPSALNNLLQGKIDRALSDLSRVMVNTGFGMLGLVDIAGRTGMPNYKEDFGQTLGWWGLEPGPYLVLPFFGPSSARDGVGLLADIYTNPVSFVEDWGTRLGLRATRLVDRRADLLKVSDTLKQATLD